MQSVGLALTHFRARRPHHDRASPARQLVLRSRRRRRPSLTTGLYTRIRNPVYVFGLLLFAGLALYVGRPWAPRRGPPWSRWMQVVRAGREARCSRRGSATLTANIRRGPGSESRAARGCSAPPQQEVRLHLAFALHDDRAALLEAERRLQFLVHDVRHEDLPASPCDSIGSPCSRCRPIGRRRNFLLPMTPATRLPVWMPIRIDRRL